MEKRNNIKNDIFSKSFPGNKFLLLILEVVDCERFVACIPTGITLGKELATLFRLEPSILMTINAWLKIVFLGNTSLFARKENCGK